MTIPLKTMLVVAALSGATALLVIFYPSKPGLAVTAPINRNLTAKPVVEAVFVLDTTGSMSGMIDTAKEKIWAIAASMASAQPVPEIRLGLVAYRDRGDTYVTQVTDLSGDLDAVYARLMELRAEGGGDGPESVNRALADAVQRISWSNRDDVYKVIFLVGDAPPHEDYADEPRFPTVVQGARDNNIIVNTIQCGDDIATEHAWRQIAQLSQGNFMNVAQSGGGIRMATPFDQQLANLARELDTTRLYFGGAEQRKALKEKQRTLEKLNHHASDIALAGRATYTSSAAGEGSMFGDNELLQEIIATGKSVDDFDTEVLPEPLQAMAPAEREAFVRDNVEKRRQLQDRIKQLSVERQAYLKKEARKLDGREASLDEQIYATVKEQAKAKAGLEFNSDSAVY